MSICQNMNCTSFQSFRCHFGQRVIQQHFTIIIQCSKSMFMYVGIGNSLLDFHFVQNKLSFQTCHGEAWTVDIPIFSLSQIFPLNQDSYFLSMKNNCRSQIPDEFRMFVKETTAGGILCILCICFAAATY